ncbi:MAG: DNA repair protein RecO [Dysosmobacter sp.]
MPGAPERRSCKYAACAQPLAYSEWTLYQRGAWYYAHEGATLELFNGLRSDLDAMALGFYFAELTEAVTTEESVSEELLRHMLNGLYALATLHKPPLLAKAAFELKLLSLAGYEPLLDGCAYCGQPIRKIRCWMWCRVSCAAEAAEQGESGLSMPLCKDSLAAARHIVYGNPKRLYYLTLGPQAQKRLSGASEAFVAAQLERGFRTLGLL